jgi:hypothetical protein
MVRAVAVVERESNLFFTGFADAIYDTSPNALKARRSYSGTSPLYQGHLIDNADRPSSSRGRTAVEKRG